MYKETW